MRNTIWAASLMAPLGLLIGCSSPVDLQAQLENAAADGSFALSQLDSVDGSSFLVICPYDSAASVDERLGFAWTDAPNLTEDDGSQVVVIVDRGEVISHEQLARDEIDFCSGDQWPVLPTTTELTATTSGGTVQVGRS